MRKILEMPYCNGIICNINKINKQVGKGHVNYTWLFIV